MTPINFDAIKTDKISLHHFPNEHLANGEPAYTLYIDSGKINFRDAVRFTGTIDKIKSEMWNTLEYKIYQRTKLMLMKFAKDYPDCEYQVYYDKEANFTYLVAKEQEGLVVRCKMKAAVNGRFTDYFTGSIEERSNGNPYYVHSMSKERRANIPVEALTPLLALQQSVIDLCKLIEPGDMMEYANRFMQVAAAKNDAQFKAVVEDDTVVLSVGDWYVNGIITKELQVAFYTSAKNDNFERFNNACGREFDTVNQLSTPARNTFRGKVWITDLNRELHPGEELYAQEVKAREIYYSRIERVNGIMANKKATA